MTTTTNSLKIKRRDRPIDAKGPIETLRAQQVKLEEALKYADDHVKYKEDTLQQALARRQEIEQDLKLTGQILARFTVNKPYEVEIVIQNATQGVEPATSFADRLRATGAVI